MARGGKRQTQVRPKRPFASILAVLSLLLLATFAGGGFFLYRQFSANLPSVEKLLDYKPPVTTRVFAADGSLLAEFFIEKRYVEPIYKIPRVVQLAFVAAEDATFYDHGGIDVISIARAAMENYRAGATRQGGSTITQQVVKALLLSPERSYERKVREMFLAFQLERALTKDEILHLYLNQIYLGSGAYGVQAAAREYFNKNLSELTLGEAALLAGLPQAPSRYSPRRDMKQAQARQKYALRQMEKAGFITQEEARAAEAEEIVLASGRPPQVHGPAPYFVEYVRRFLVKRYGGTAAYKLGLDVHTTLDPQVQAHAERALREGITEIDERQGFRGPRRSVAPEQWRPLLEAARPTAPDALPPRDSSLEVVVVPGADGRLERSGGGVHVLWAQGTSFIGPQGFAWAKRGGYKPKTGDLLQAIVTEQDGRPALEIAHDNGTQGALIATHPANGDVLAMVGGLDFADSEFNRATQALRQPGSAFKPLIFTAALDRGFTPSTVIQDAPVTYHIGPGQVWAPKNFTKRFYGPTTIREALTKSRNVVTVKLTKAMGLNYLRDYLPNFGFTRRFPKNLSIALGSAEVTLLEMVEAYGVFANLGLRVEPRFITRINDRQGQLLEAYPVLAERAIPAETAYLTVNLMRNVIENGTGRRARLDRAAAGKTGTTNDLRDAWFVGYTPELLAGVWVGYDHDRTLGKKETGGRSAAPIWKSFMEGTLDGLPVQDFPVPEDIVLVNVDKKSGQRAAPGQAGTVLGAYRRGTEPAPLREPGSSDQELQFGQARAAAAPRPASTRIWPRPPESPERRNAGDRWASRGSNSAQDPRAWGDRPAPDPSRRAWGDRPAPDPDRRAWGNQATDASLPSWARFAEPSDSERRRWSRSLDTGKTGDPAPEDTRNPTTASNSSRENL